MSIRRNSLYGLLGFALPTLVVLVAYPVLVRTLGPQAFGIYLIATSMSGVLGFLDFGFSAATVQFVAQDMARNDRRAAAEVLVTSLAFYGAIGLAGAMVIFGLAPYLVHVFSVQPQLQSVAVVVFRIAAVQFAVFFLLTVYLSFFKGMQRFDLSTVVLSSLSALTYGGAVIGVKLAGTGLLGVTAISLTANVIVLAAATIMAARLYRSAGMPTGLRRASVQSMRRMFGFGMFIAIEKTAGILANQVLRLVMAALLGPAAVTVFVTAFTITSKIAAALRATFEVLMPATASLVHERGEGRQRRLRRIYLRSVAISTLVGGLGMGLLYLNAGELVTWWLRSPISGEVSALVKILCVGFAANCVTVVMYHTIAGVGRPIVNAIATVLEPLLIYAVVAILALDGLSISDFAIALSVDLCIHAAFYVAFCELVVWRQWMPRLMRQGEVNAGAAL